MSLIERLFHRVRPCVTCTTIAVGQDDFPGKRFGKETIVETGKLTVTRRVLQDLRKSRLSNLTFLM
jgi:hypothetical protein